MKQTAFRLDQMDYEVLDDVVKHQLLGVGNRSDALRYIIRQHQIETRKKPESQ